LTQSGLFEAHGFLCRSASISSVLVVTNCE
jgi:hypothetical protein